MELADSQDLGSFLWPIHKTALQSKSPQVKGNDSSNSELDSLNEEEEVSEADNREKEILIDRLQSIKEEK